MDRHQTAAILTRIASAYPPLSITAETFEVWHDSLLATVDTETANRAAQWVMRNDQRFPSLARFREVIAAQQRADQPTVRAVTDGEPVDRETSRRWLAACRKVVTRT